MHQLTDLDGGCHVILLFPAYLPRFYSDIVEQRVDRRVELLVWAGLSRKTQFCIRDQTDLAKWILGITIG